MLLVVMFIKIDYTKYYIYSCITNLGISLHIHTQATVIVFVNLHQHNSAYHTNLLSTSDSAQDMYKRFNFFV